MPLLGRGFHVSTCLLGVILSFGVHPSLAAVGSTSQWVGQCLFRPLDHAGVELGVTPGVLCEVVAPHEALLTEWTAELLFPSVGPVVAGQLVRAGELFKAVWPRAGKGPFTYGNQERTLFKGHVKQVWWPALGGSPRDSKDETPTRSITGWTVPPSLSPNTSDLDSRTPCPWVQPTMDGTH